MIRQIKSFCVNLDRRPDRWRSVSDEFKKIEIEPTRISALEQCYPECKMTWNQTSVLHSHKKIWKIIIDEKIKIAAVFEDDVVFTSDFHKILEKSLNEIPKNWELLNLHSTHAGVKPLGNYTNVVLKDLWGAHGYVLKREAAVKLMSMCTQVDGALSRGFFEAGGIPYGIKEEWTVCFQKGDDSDIPETQQLDFWNQFKKKYWR